jgi:uncharacterized membrane protein
MDELHLSNLVIAAGCLLVVAGVLHLFCQALEVRQAKQGRISATLNVRKWSCRSIFLGIIMIGLGAALLGGGHFLSL